MVERHNKIKDEKLKAESSIDFAMGGLANPQHDKSVQSNIN